MANLEGPYHIMFSYAYNPWIIQINSRQIFTTTSQCSKQTTHL